VEVKNMLAKNKQEFFKYKDQAMARHKELYEDFGVLLSKPYHDVEFNCWILDWCSPQNKIIGFNTDLEGENTPNALGGE
jgi:hypothetical protein